MTDTTQHQQHGQHGQHGQPGQSQEPVTAAAELTSAGPATATVRLPFGSVTLSLPQVTARLAGQQGEAGAGRGRAGVERLALYGGAALLGALEIVEWPVVLAAAGGTYLLSRVAARGSGPGDGSHTPHAGHEHTHGPDCGHAVIPHGDHSDYLHDGHRHAAHDEHWDEH